LEEGEEKEETTEEVGLSKMAKEITFWMENLDI
jgi:hypothetical protein